jgi:nitric oxide reductase subunit B
MSIEKLKWAAIVSFIVSMVVLIGGGFFAKDWYPPYPGKVVDEEGKVLFQKQDILAGQDVYQRYGLMDHGSVWGHGSQRGMEFSAVTLHLLGETVRESLSQKGHGKSFQELDPLAKEIITLKSTRKSSPIATILRPTP